MRNHCRLVFLILIELFASTLSGCATTDRLHAADTPEGALRVVEVMRVASGKEIGTPGERPVYEMLQRTGLSDSDIQAGSIGGGRVFCCWRPNEKANEIYFFAPMGITVQVGEIVEVKMGRHATRADPGAVNTAIQIRQKSGVAAGTCRWDPPGEGLWSRVLYCDWMKEEGWRQQIGLYNVWYKPAQ